VYNPSLNQPSLTYRGIGLELGQELVVVRVERPHGHVADVDGRILAAV